VPLQAFAPVFVIVIESANAELEVNAKQAIAKTKRIMLPSPLVYRPSRK
jgi:hypothetical protein